MARVRPSAMDGLDELGRAAARLELERIRPTPRRPTAANRQISQEALLELIHDVYGEGSDDGDGR